EAAPQTISAVGLSAARRRASSGDSGCRSVLLTTTRSATAAWRDASAKRAGAGHRIDQGDDPRERQARIEHRVGPEGVEDRRRVGEAAGLDDDAAERPHRAGVAPVDEVAQGAREVLAHRAAEAAAGQFEHVAL